MSAKRFGTLFERLGKRAGMPLRNPNPASRFGRWDVINRGISMFNVCMRSQPAVAGTPDLLVGRAPQQRASRVAPGIAFS
jgi:hypothetical protein